MARVQAVKPAEQHRQWRAWLRRLGLLGLVASVLAAGLAALNWLSDPAKLPVRKLRLQGEMAHLDQSQVRTTLQPFLQSGLLGVNVEQVRQAVEAMPWIRSATVRRSWPDTLVIGVIEHEAMARWRQGGYVSTEKTHFAPAQADDKSLPLLGGPEGSAGMLAAYYQDLSVLIAPLDVQISELEMTERRAWRMRLSNGIEVLLGRQSFETRMARFLRHYTRVVAPKEGRIAGVDMRYTNGFSIRWKDREQSTADEGRGEANV